MKPDKRVSANAHCPEMIWEEESVCAEDKQCVGGSAIPEAAGSPGDKYIAQGLTHICMFSYILMVINKFVF